MHIQLKNERRNLSLFKDSCIVAGAGPKANPLHCKNTSDDNMFDLRLIIHTNHIVTVYRSPHLTSLEAL